ncbi:MAG: peptide-methionine (R)-S-oxide reductase MsrB [Flavobacteriaceae bacterium]|nr:peptide-methionine (R)-S-oxide reductase MsrB [Flavobacteriaceae bacterium]
MRYLLSLLMLCSCSLIFAQQKTYKVQKTEAQWQAELPDAVYKVLRQAYTERPFSSSLNNNYEKGLYQCAGCSAALYRSENKYDSGSGWPSFDRSIKNAVAYDVDYKLGYKRTEVHCANCGGHLGHVFDDGPSDTTGKRHCINGLALTFTAADE